MKLTAEEKETIANENINLVYFMVNKFKNNRIEEAELISAAHFGFTRALNSFDKEKGVKVSTFICNCITNEFLREIDKEKRRQRLKYISLDDDRNDDDGEKTYHDVIESDVDYIGEAEMNLIIERASKRLDHRRGLILKGLLEEKTQTQIGLEIGRSSEAVRQSIFKIKNEFEKEMGKIK